HLHVFFGKNQVVVGLFHSRHRVHDLKAEVQIGNFQVPLVDRDAQASGIDPGIFQHRLAQLQKTDAARSVLKRKTGRHRVVVRAVVGNGVAGVDVHEAVRDDEGTVQVLHRAGLCAGTVGQTSAQIVSQTPGKQSVDAGSEVVSVALRSSEW